MDSDEDRCLVCLVFWLDETNQMNQINQVASVLLSGWESGLFPLKKADAGLIELAVPAKPGRGVFRWVVDPRSVEDHWEASKAV
jgi:hypothetical protein